MYEYALWHDVRGVNVWLRVRTRSAHEVGRCFWQQCAHGFEVRIHIRIWHAKSPETCEILKSWKSQKSRLFAKSRDFRDFQDFLGFPGFPGFRDFSGFPHFGARIAVLAPRSEILVRQDSGLGARFGRSWADLTDLAESPEIWCRTRKSTSQVLYIDHFQLPPRWKMTGEEGDPFGGRRWHWPSKPCNF